jgi:hypothetical protein
MAEFGELVGEGTLYDTDDNELATVAYRIEQTADDGGNGPTWGGELVFRDGGATLEPGLYVLATEDGTQTDIDLEPAGAAGGDPSRARFKGVGTFGQRIA